MEKFNSFEFNAENVIGGTAIAPVSLTTPCVTIPSVTATVDPTPTVTAVKSTVAGVLTKVGTVASSVVAAAPTVTVGTGTGCGC